MKLSVYRDNALLFELDLGRQARGPQSLPVEFYVGRDEDCHVVLDHQQISRKHVVIKRIDGQWRLQRCSELGTLLVNGSFVMGRAERSLASGDLISLPPFTLVVAIPSVVPSSDLTLDSQSDVASGPAKDPALFAAFRPEVPPSPVLPMEELPTAIEEEAESDVPESEAVEAPSEDEFAQASEEMSLEEATEASEENIFGGEMAAQTQSDLGNLPSLVDGPANEEEESGSEHEESTRVLNSFARYKLKIFGEFAPYDEYLIKDSRTVIGRDATQCQVVLSDPESSQQHAVIIKQAMMLVLEDLASSNGTLYNGKRINRTELRNGDEFVIGTTSFTVIIESDQLAIEQERLMPVAGNQEVEIEEVIEEEVDFNDAHTQTGIGATEGDTQSVGTSRGPNKSLIQGILSDPAKRKKVVYGIVVVALAFVLLSEDEKPPEKKGDPGQAQSKSNNLLTDKGTSRGDVATDISGDRGPASIKSKKTTLTPEMREYLEGTYVLVKEYYNKGAYQEAMRELENIHAIAPEGYKESGQIHNEIKLALESVQKAEEKKRRKQEREERDRKVKELVARAQKAVDEKNVIAAEGLFVKILELDPEHPDVGILKLTLDGYKKQQEQERLEKERKEADRKQKVMAMQDGKNFHAQKNWFMAINKLEKFLQIPNMDEDLVQEATTLLEQARASLKQQVDPAMGKAKSLQEGQDLKGAYENYVQALMIDPNNEEALYQLDFIKQTLDSKAATIYKEALIAESLSLFENAKEKYDEVLQITPKDSEYNKKARDRLKNYFE